ncbi:hypothetical protein D5S17_10830 [Pseudonocardiaceae bacterium YIM PH 21723]|nr:hypothetical protein D5S17_10830 [Pseudonocardiaceae bacterium YIM PH 21723]
MEFGILGKVCIWRAGEETEVSGALQRRLLAALLMEPGRQVARHRLYELLWGEDLPPTPRNSLQAIISRLRKEIAGTSATIVADTTGYRIEVEPDRVDLHRFRRLAASADTVGSALRLWRGPEVHHCPVRGSLVRERLAAVVLHAETDLLGGQAAEVAQRLPMLIDEFPGSEKLVELQMAALHRLGQLADARSAYERLHEFLSLTLGVEPGPDLRFHHQELLRAVPRQLPALSPVFVARQDELAQLDAHLRAADGVPMVISAISGTGGVGKTALALHWAHAHRERFPDGQLYVNLQGFGAAAPLTPSSVLYDFLRALGVHGDQIPSELDERSSLFREHLIGRRTLMILDNARDTEQLRPLLPKGDCCVLVTSRNTLRQLGDNGVRRIDLSRLTPADGLALLRDVLGPSVVERELDAARRLVDLCDGLPLALRLIAERAGHRVVGYGDSRLAHLVDQLTHEHSALDMLDVSDDDIDSDLRSVFSWSVRQLSAEQAELFQLIAVLPGRDIGLAAVAALLGTTEQRAARPLRALVDAHLVEPRGRGRYGMHDLLRTYGSELPGEHERAMERLLSWYLHSAHAAARTIMPQITPLELPAPPLDVRPLEAADYDTAADWFEVEQNTLVALVGTIADPGMAWRLSYCLHPFLKLRKYATRWIPVLRQGIEAAVASGDRWACAQLMKFAANAYNTHRRYDEAVAAGIRAVEQFRILADRTGEASALNELAIAHRLSGDLRQGLAYFRQCEAMCREEGEATGVALVQNNIANVLMELDEVDEAITSYRDALTASRALGLPSTEVRSLTGLAAAYREQGELGHALELITESVRLSRQLRDDFEYARAADEKAITLHAMGRFEEAYECWSEAAALFETLDPSRAERIRADLAAMAEDPRWRR